MGVHVRSSHFLPCSRSSELICIYGLSLKPYLSPFDFFRTVYRRYPPSPARPPNNHETDIENQLGVCFGHFFSYGRWG